MDYRAPAPKRRRTQPSDGDSFIRQVRDRLMSDDPASRLWAMDQLPIYGIKGGPEITLECFQYIRGKVDYEDLSFCDSLQAALNKEAQKPSTRHDQRAKFIIPLAIDAVYSDFEGGWGDILQRLCQSVKTSIAQSIVFDMISTLSKNYSMYPTVCVIRMICGICDAGASIPQYLITTLVSRPQVVQQCLTSFLRSVFSNQPQSFSIPVFESLSREIGDPASIANAVLSLHNPPPRVFEQAVLIIKTHIGVGEIGAVAARHSDRLVSSGRFTDRDILSIVMNSPVLSTQNASDAITFYKRHINTYKEKDAMQMIQRVAVVDTCEALNLIKLFLQKPRGPTSLAFIISFMSKPTSFAYISEWCTLFASVTEAFPDESTTVLVQRLIQYLSGELREGHLITFAQDKSSGEPSSSRSTGPVAVHRWRTAAQLLIALSKYPNLGPFRCTSISLCKRAIEIHGYPVVYSVSCVVCALGLTPDMCEMFDWMLEGNSSRRISFFRIIPWIAEKVNARELVKRYGAKIIQTASECKISSERCSAIEALASFAPLGTVLMRCGLFEVAMVAIRRADFDENPAIIDVVKKCKVKLEELENTEDIPLKEENIPEIVNKVEDPIRPRKLMLSNRSGSTRRLPRVGIAKPTASVNKLASIFRPTYR